MRLIKAVLATVIGLSLLAVGALLLLPTERIAALAAQQFEIATGRSLRFSGGVAPRLYPVIGARVHQVEISNPSWAGPEPMLVVEDMDVGLDLGALVRGDIAVERLILQSPKLRLLRNAEGQTNWEFGAISAPAQPVPQSPQGRMRQVSVVGASIRDATVHYNDAVSGTDITLSALDVDLTLPSGDGSLQVSGSARANGQPVTLEFAAASAAQLVAGALTQVEFSAAADAARVGFSGLAALENMSLQGSVTLSLPSLSPLQRLIGQPVAALPGGLVPMSLSGQMTRTGAGAIFLREASFGFGPNRLSGAADMALSGPRPRLTAQLEGDMLDLRGLVPTAAARPGSAGQGSAMQPWSSASIDAGALGLMDADLSLTLRGVATDALTLGRSRLGLAIDNSRAVLTLREAAVFGGAVTGELIANNRSGLSVGGNLNAAGIALLPFLTDMADFRRLQGNANAQLQFLGSGNSVQAIMNSLRGEGSLRFDQGEILGLDLAGMLRNLDLGYMGEGARTVYDSITGSFIIEGGVLRNSDLRLEAPRISMTGQGTVGLGARVLDYRLVPTALRDAQTGEGLRVPLLITGPWDAPRFRLDLEALARERLQGDQERLEQIARDEARRIEDRARAEAESRIERELGVERREDEALQDTLRRGLEQEIGNRLRGLLGGN